MRSTPKTFFKVEKCRKETSATAARKRLLCTPSSREREREQKKSTSLGWTKKKIDRLFPVNTLPWSHLFPRSTGQLSCPEKAKEKEKNRVSRMLTCHERRSVRVPTSFLVGEESFPFSSGYIEKNMAQLFSESCAGFLGDSGLEEESQISRRNLMNVPLFSPEREKKTKKAKGILFSKPIYQTMHCPRKG